MSAKAFGSMPTFAKPLNDELFRLEELERRINCFPADFNSRLKQAMSELPANFDMLWGGGAIRNKDYPYTPNINIMNGRWGCYCMIIRNTVYDFFISKFKEEQHSSDTYYSEYHRKFNSFVTVQELVKHIGNVSDRMIVNHA